MDGSIGQSTTPIIHDGPFLRSGPSGQIWNLVGKLKRDHFYLLTDAGACGDRPDLLERQKEAFKGGRSEDT